MFGTTAKKLSQPARRADGVQISWQSAAAAAGMGLLALTGSAAVGPLQSPAAAQEQEYPPYTEDVPGETEYNRDMSGQVDRYYHPETDPKGSKAWRDEAEQSGRALQDEVDQWRDDGRSGLSPYERRGFRRNFGD